MTDNLNQNDMTREELTKAIDEWAKGNDGAYILLATEGEQGPAFIANRGSETQLAALMGIAFMDAGDVFEAAFKALRAITFHVGKEALRRQNA